MTLTQGRRLIETRILKHDVDGWVGLPYIWNKDQTEATLDVAGDTADVSWIHDDGRTRSVNYIIPNANQCKGCHKAGETMLPIGPKARHLNRDFAYRRRNREPVDSLVAVGGPAGAPAPQRRRGWRSGTIPRPARSTTEPGPGSRSTALTAIARRGRRAARASTCSHPSAIRPVSA